jgi:hypothetical protein
LSKCICASSGDISRALLRSDRGERGPALLDTLAAATWALDFAFLVVDQRQNLGEELLAVQAEEFIVGHLGPPGGKESTGVILNLVESALNHVVLHGRDHLHPADACDKMMREAIQVV